DLPLNQRFQGDVTTAAGSKNGKPGKSTSPGSSGGGGSSPSTTAPQDDGNTQAAAEKAAENGLCG
ncbi:MAG: hypothetical protein HOQ22_14990, partial [Nocardioidaceae bacterium]|nr:hypothetical protein [Nocardioidaceae bacterium]